MNESFRERRGAPRVSLMTGGELVLSESFVLPTWIEVQLLEIGDRGVLLSSSELLEVGRRAHLRASLPTGPVSLDIEIRRIVDTGPGNDSEPERFRCGAAFLFGKDERSRRSIEQLLTGASAVVASC